MAHPDGGRDQQATRPRPVRELVDAHPEPQPPTSLAPSEPDQRIEQPLLKRGATPWVRDPHAEFTLHERVRSLDGAQQAEPEPRPAVASIPDQHHPSRVAGCVAELRPLAVRFSGLGVVALEAMERFPGEKWAQLHIDHIVFAMHHDT